MERNISTPSGINYTESINPATGKIIGKSELTAADTIPQVISRAREAQKKWYALPLKERIKILERIKREIAVQGDELSSIISSDNGKTRIEAMATEILPSAMAVDYYCKNAGKFLKERRVGGGNIFLVNKRSRIRRVPYGVVGIISPWNYPFSIPFSEVVMALLAGNSVILKTASETQLAGLKLKEIFNKAGLPPGVFNYVNLPGRIAGELFLKSGIDKLFFTGSVAVGKKLMSLAGETLIHVSLELGGNDPMIVCPDADIDRAAYGALWGGFQNSGQSCGGVERIYVHEEVYDEFLAKLKPLVENLVPGNGNEFDTQMGCLTTSNQADTVRMHVREALDSGAEIFARSKNSEGLGEGNFVPALVITNVNHNMLLMKDETFGPVVGVMKFSNYEEAVELANDSYLGLTASVWSRNRKFAVDLGKRLMAGAVTINDHLMSHGLAETPWGGFKQSGIGRTHGEIGFAEMTQPQVIVDDLFSFMKRNLWWHPYDKYLYSGISGLLQLLYSGRFKERITGLKNLLKIFPRVFSAKD